MRRHVRQLRTADTDIRWYRTLEQARAGARMIADNAAVLVITRTDDPTNYTYRLLKECERIEP